MALTEQNKADIRFFLGWPARFHSTDSRLEHAMSALETQPEAETNVLDLITQAKAVKTALTDSHTRLKAAQIGSIKLPMANEIKVLRSRGREIVGGIASTMGVPVVHDVFSSGGPKGFLSPGFSTTSNLIPEG